MKVLYRHYVASWLCFNCSLNFSTLKTSSLEMSLGQKWDFAPLPYCTKMLKNGGISYTHMQLGGPQENYLKR